QWYEANRAMPVMRTDEAIAKQGALTREVSSYLTELSPSDILYRTDEQPTGGQSQEPVIFVPETAVEFPDGRIGVPASLLVPRNDPTYIQKPPPVTTTLLDVLSNESGKWLLDEQIIVCIGDCEEDINGGDP